MEKENSKSLMSMDLMILYPCVASFLDYIDALYIDHDLGCLNMSEVRYERVMDKYNFCKHFNGRGSQGTVHVPPVNDYDS